MFGYYRENLHVNRFWRLKGKYLSSDLVLPSGILRFSFFLGRLQPSMTVNKKQMLSSGLKLFWVEMCLVVNVGKIMFMRC